MKPVSIEDVKHFIRAGSEYPLIHVNGMDDPTYKNMEEHDKNTFINVIKKYQVKGESGGITGKRTYGYDKSRVDRALIRRRRQN